MNKSIGSIAWPEDPGESRRLLSTYMVEVVESLGISFGISPYEPLSVVNGLRTGEMSGDDGRAAMAYWWGCIDQYGIRNFESKEALIARLAICLLTPSQQETWDFGDQLSWFLEVLGFLGEDVDKSIALMEEHFDFLGG